MEENIKDLLEYTKEQNHFPPIHEFSRISSELMQRGLGANVTYISKICEVCLDSADKTLNDFMDSILNNRDHLTLPNEDDLHNVANEGLGIIFTEISGVVKRESCKVSGQTKERIIQEMNQHVLRRQEKLKDSLHRKIRLRDLQMEKSKSSISISGGQIGQVVVGDVNLSNLNASLQSFKQKNAGEGELAQILENFLEVIKQVDERHLLEKKELFDLTKGLLTQLNVPKEDRSVSVIRIAWSRICEISQTIHSVKNFMEQTPQILGLLGLSP